MTPKVEKRKQKPGLSLAWSTDIGLVRRRNEDSLFIAPPPGDRMSSHGQLLIVADGMGGPPAGDVASGLATKVIPDCYYGMRLEVEGDPVPLLRDAFQEANRAIIQSAREDSARFGMGSTCTALLLRGENLWTAHVGDSRAYLWREGRLEMLSRDHNVLERMRAEGREFDASEPPPGARLLTAALGTDERLKADFSQRPRRLRSEDRLLLCSDGLSGAVEEDELVKSLGARSPQAVVKRLLRKALDAGGRDNITLIVADWRDST